MSTAEQKLLVMWPRVKDECDKCPMARRAHQAEEDAQYAKETSRLAFAVLALTWVGALLLVGAVIWSRS